MTTDDLATIFSRYKAHTKSPALFKIIDAALPIHAGWQDKGKIFYISFKLIE
jgi:hypothetical protein